MWDIDSSQFCFIYLDIIIVSSPCWKPWKPYANVLISVSPRSLKHGNTGARGTWQNQHFQQQRAMDFFNPRNVLWTSLLWKWPRNAMRLGSKTHFQWYVFAGVSAPHHFQNFICLRRSTFIVNFSVPWPIAGTSPCWHCSFSIHIDMLGWTAVGWAGHRCVSLHGHKWSLCTMSTAYQFAAFQQLYSVLACSVFAFCEWTQSDSVCTYFMYMNQKQTSQLMYHVQVHSTSFNEDEPSRPYYQERSHPPSPPANPPNQHPAYQHLCHFMKMNHRGPGRTSPCHKNNMNYIFM